MSIIVEDPPRIELQMREEWRLLEQQEKKDNQERKEFSCLQHRTTALFNFGEMEIMDMDFGFSMPAIQQPYKQQIAFNCNPNSSKNR